MKRHVPSYLAVFLIAATAMWSCFPPARADTSDRIQSFCIDFNWGAGGPNGFPAPGTFAQADPTVHYQFYKDLGVNVIQTYKDFNEVLNSVRLAGLASEVARLRARFVIKDSDDSLKGAA